jgi:uncharacterized phage infection (PIP) family protein YhgE
MDALATKSDLSSLRIAVDTQARELNNYRREAQDREERLFEALTREQQARQELSDVFTKKMNTRRRFEAAALAAAVTLIVGLSQVFSSHSYAQAQVQVHEMNRQDRTEELGQLKAHDELVIKKALDERDARIEA